MICDLCAHLQPKSGRCDRCQLELCTPCHDDHFLPLAFKHSSIEGERLKRMAGRAKARV